MSEEARHVTATLLVGQEVGVAAAPAPQLRDELVDLGVDDRLHPPLPALGE
jgi:hypothetical protein